MTTSQELIAAIAAASLAIAEGKVSSFREHESQATMHSLDSISNLLGRLVDEDVRAAIDGTDTGPIKKFAPPWTC